MSQALGRFSPYKTPMLTMAVGLLLCCCQIASGADVNNKLVSRASGNLGAIGNGDSKGPDLTPDGKFVVFESSASNLVPGGSSTRQAYLRNLVTGAMELVSQNASGGPGNGASYQPHISSDGRYVSFSSAATDLVAGDTNAQDDIFVRDRQTGTTQRISLPPTGQADGPSFQSRISGDGRFVLFESRATNLITGDANGMSDGFLWDRNGGTLERVTLSSTGGELSGSPGGRNEPTSLSDDGRYIAFQTDLGVSNAVPNDTNNAQDVFIRDRTLATTTRLSVNGGGVEGNGQSTFPFISRDGNTVVFSSLADNLAPGDTNGFSDVFVWRRATGQLTRITDANGNCAQATASSDGRFIAFASQATNLAPGITGNFGNQFLYDSNTGETALLSRASDGQSGNGNSGSHELPGQQFEFCCYAYASSDGRYVAYDSDASNLVFDDVNGHTDIFVHDRAPEVVARAGGDHLVVEGQAVALDGSASLGAGLAFAWSQTSGPVITNFNGEASPKFVFTAPPVTGTQVLVVRLVVTDSAGVSSFDTVNITVADSDAAFIDSDGDGIPDEDEVAAGTDPYDPNSKPFPLDVVKLRMRVNFAATGKDSLRFDAMIDAPPGFTRANLAVGVKCAGIRNDLVLNSKGRSPRGNVRVNVRYKRPRKGQEFAGGPVKVSVTLRRATFMPGLGLPNVDQKSGTYNVPLLLAINGKIFAASVPGSVRSKQDRNATLKTLRARRR